MSQLVTGEAVVLQVRIARMPTRALACAIDFTIQCIVIAVLLTSLFGFLIGSASEALGVALVFIVLLLVLIGYRVLMETLTRGRTLGKMMLGLKVVRDDGSSIRFRHALVRNLLWLFVDFAPWFAACPGIVASLMNKQGKRIGDMVAGTVVIRERHQPMASPPLFVPGHLVQWAQSLELSRLSDELANTAREYLARYTELEPTAQVALGDALAFRVGGVTAPSPPVAISSPAFLSAVLAERRRRELARLATQRPAYATNTGPFGPTTPYAPPSPYGAPQPGPFLAPQQVPYSPPPPVAPRPQDAVVNPGGWHAPGSNEPGQSY
ncbi:RDD family protein [Kribbella qitaiheensis]|uniref:RDD family protein n=1 Tax=Kribbella qitaiheensis TaxID=1544730 RepID=UPI00361F3EAA